MKRSSRVVARVMGAAINNLSYCSKHKTTMSTIAAASACTCPEQKRQMQHQHHQKIIDLSDGTPSKAAAASTIITPPPSPQLLLEGDEMYISSDGKSHTYYRLLNTSKRSQCQHHSTEYLLEEAYDIENARKEITLLQRRSSIIDNDDDNSCNEDRMSTTTTITSYQKQLSNIFSFPLQEINKGIQTGAGTGSITWDSSIVMGLYFGLYPEELVGGVLELGSGVGLGGILTLVASTSTSMNAENDDDEEEDNNMTSFTLTEMNMDIINMLRYNTTMAEASNPSSGVFGKIDELHIEQMNWFDFVVGTNQHHSTTTTATPQKKKYDTIIASDCIYLPSQIKPLSETIVQLLGHDNDDGGRHASQKKAHIFSPYNRRFIQDLVDELRGGKNMIVQVETIAMSKYRVKSNDRNTHVVSNSWIDCEEDITKSKITQDVASARSGGITSNFLHITASFEKDGVKAAESVHNSDGSMTDID